MKKQNEWEAEKTKTNYTLKSDAVETLANADHEQAPEYSEEELKKYRSKKGIHLSEPLKILLIKAWFAGAVCFFILWGLGLYLGNNLDMLFVLGVVMGMVTDLLVNSVIRFVEKTPGENDWWMMFPKKGLGSFLLNILYGFVIVICVYLLYNGINGLLSIVFQTTDKVYLGVEPILFGTFCMGFDMLFVWIKGTVVKLIRNARGK